MQIKEDPRRKEKINDTYFNIIDTEEKAYFLGLLASDGSISKDRNRIVLSLHKQDKQILDIFSGIIGTTVKYMKTKPNMCTVTFTSKQIKKDLLKYKITPNKINTIQLPNINSLLLKHFIRGYFDGDGSINQYNVYVCSKSKNIITDIKDHLNSQIEDLLSDIYLQAKTGVYYLRFLGFKERRKVLSYLYENANIYLERKYKKALETHLAPQMEKSTEQIAEKTVNSENKAFICSKCNIEKKISEFVKKKGLTNNLASHCKQCQNKYMKEWKKQRERDLKVLDNTNTRNND